MYYVSIYYVTANVCCPACCVCVGAAVVEREEGGGLKHEKHKM